MVKHSAESTVKPTTNIRMRSRSRPRDITPLEVPTGRVTAITPSPRAAGRFDLVIEGEPTCRLSIEAIERLRLHVGAEIGEPAAAQIALEADTVRVYDRAMMMLAARGRASGELRRLLIRKKETPVIVDEAIARLRAAGFLDDAAFARQFTRYRAVNGGLSRRRIQGELARRGVDRAIATDAVVDVFAEENVDEIVAMEQAAEKRLRSMSKLDAPTKRRRLYSFLARRGYDADAIKEVVQRLTKVGGEWV
jgi:regulatory protein